MKFEKYQGLGNDFIILDEDIDEKRVKELCDRHFGIGADGLIIYTYKDGLPYMKFFNADGSRAKMCGNGIRCYAAYLYSKKIPYTKIYTLAGIKEIEKIDDKYKVYMGKAKIDFLEYSYKDLKLNSINTGTEHCVIIADKSLKELEIIAKDLSNRKDLFPKGTNVNMINIKDRKNIQMYTYERGVGITLACGTGACASAYLANLKKLVEPKVRVQLLGGVLEITISKDDIYMLGDAKKVFEGEI